MAEKNKMITAGQFKMLARRAQADSTARIANLAELIIDGYGQLVAVTLPAANWSEGLQKAEHGALLADSGYVYFVCGDADCDNVGLKVDNVTKDGEMMFQCENPPDVDLTVNILRVEVESSNANAGTVFNLTGRLSKSVYQQAVEGGYKGIEDEFNAILASGPWVKGNGSLAVENTHNYVISIGKNRGDVEEVWTETTLPSSGVWSAIAYGNGKFVAVEEGSNKVAYSADGINWTAATLPFYGSWNAIAYGNGKFVAVVEGNDEAAYSADGINWTTATLPFYGVWSAITYGNGKFVAVARGSNKAVYSEDGISWMESTLPISSYWNAIAYGNGKFVAVTKNYEAAYSADGINWTESTFPLGSYYSAITYGNGKFVAVVQGNDEAAYSADGINWTTATLPFYGVWSAVAYGNGKFVAVVGGSNKVAYSENGINWTAVNPPLFGGHSAIAYGNGKFVAVSEGYDKAACLSQSPLYITVGGKQVGGDVTMAYLDTLVGNISAILDSINGEVE